MADGAGMARHVVLADSARRQVLLADAPKPRLDAGRIASALGARQIRPAPPGGGSPVCWYAARKATLAAPPPAGGPDPH